MPPTVQLLDEQGNVLLDASSYVRVASEDGMDPYPQFSEPSFSDAPLGEGQPLLGVDERNREMLFPLAVKSSAKDAQHALLSSISDACARARTLLWQDDGASAASYLDVTFARLDIAYRYWPARNAWHLGVLRVFCAPPFAHTGTSRIVATALASSAAGAPPPVATLPAGSVVGDVPALARMTLTPASAAPGPGGRVVGVAALPTGYRSWIPAASMFNVNSRATLTGASGAPGSQVIAPATVGLASTPLLARFALSASPHAGRNRVLGVVRPGGAQGLHLHVTSEQTGRPIGPTALAAGLNGMQLVDLGVANVATHQATHSFSVGGGPPVTQPDDSSLRLLVGADRALGQLAGVIVAPEDTLTLALDPLEQIAGRHLAASGQATALVTNLTDDFGNAYLASCVQNNASVVVTSTGAVPVTGAPGGVGLALPDAGRDVRLRTSGFLWSLATVQSYLALGLHGAQDTSAGMLWLAFYAGSHAGASGCMCLTLQGKDSTGNVLGATTLVPSKAAFSAPSAQVILDLYRQGAAAVGELRLTNATGVTTLVGGGATTVPVARVALLSDQNVRAIDARYMSAWGVGPHSAITGHRADRILNSPAAGDAYTLDGAGGAYRTPVAASGSVDLSDRLRGAALTLDPNAAAVLAFAAPRDGGPMNDPLSVEIRVRERFRFHRG